jgi:ABC-type sugar transport system ATPase subunit
VPVNFRSPRDAGRAGVGMVHQELAFCPDLSVAENLCMGMYPRRAGLLVNRGEMRRRADDLLRKIGVEMDVRQPIGAPLHRAGAAGADRVGVGTGAKILIFDEPTSSLSEPEAQRLFALMNDLKRRGVTMIYVSHRMPEVFRLCDRLSVLRDGRYVGTLDAQPRRRTTSSA